MHRLFVEFDYSAYHPRIIAKMIDYTFESGNPYDEIPKEVMFQNLYGGIRKEHIHEPFFAKLDNYLNHKWDEFTSDGALDLVMTKIPASRIENPNKNKILSPPRPPPDPTYKVAITHKSTSTCDNNCAIK